MKIHGTRKEKAAELYRRLEQGPAFSEPFDTTPFSVEDAKSDYRIWSQSWILQQVCELVPELRWRLAKGISSGEW